MKRSWTDWYWLVWLIVAVGLGFGIPEALSLADGDPSTQPLTNWTVSRGLAEVAITLGLWLAVHFSLRARK